MKAWVRTPRAYVLLLAITLGLRVATALPLEQPGYMDASYAIHVAENLASGLGLSEQVLWNYLDEPAGLPHPSNLYWMPLPSLLIAPFFWLFGVSYRVSQIPFVLLSCLLPLYAFHLSRRVFGRDGYAWATALLTAFSGFYTVYWVSPDNFTPFALTSSVSLYFMARGLDNSRRRYWLLAGILAGLSHLARADGVLLLAIPPAIALVKRDSSKGRNVLRATGIVVLGYLLIMGPWFIRNYVVAGTPYPSVGAKTIWLTNYDEIFGYANDLSPARYLAWGVGPIIVSKIYAAGLDLFVLIFGPLQLFLAPFALIGLGRLRNRTEFIPFLRYAILLYAIMVLVFTFPSWRGSMLHSAGALVPFLATAVPPGIDLAAQWVARRRRNWQPQQAALFFRWGFVALAILTSLYVYGQGIFGPVFGGPANEPLWNQRDHEYGAVTEWMDRNASPEDILFDIDPPSYFNASHRRAIMLPTDGIQAVLGASKQYGVNYMLLRHDHPRLLDDLYRERVTVPGVVQVARFEDVVHRPVILYELQGSKR